MEERKKAPFAQAHNPYVPIRFHKRISFKLARISFLVAFLLGLGLSSVQVYFDFKSEERELDAGVQRILSVVARPAARAVHLLDEDLAAEVIQGIMEYEFISNARIDDELGISLAEKSRPFRDSKSRWLTRWIKGDTKTYDAALETSQIGNVVPGQLHITVDVDCAFLEFYERSLFVLGTGIIRIMILVILFFLIFYALLTKPLINLMESFQSIDPENPGRSRFHVSSGHDEDELGMLAKSGNEFLDANDRHLRQRNEAQAKLKDAYDDLEHRTEELRNAKEMAEFASRSKSQFLANMSHELRTPLNAIIGFSKIMKEQMFGPVGSQKYLEYSGDILSSSSHLLSVISDILDVSKIEAGELVLDISEVDIAHLATACETLLHEQILQKELSVLINIPEGFPKLLADELRIKQIFINLFSNAVKFTSEGGKFWVLGELQSNGGMTIRVEDNGIGISPEDIPKVLEPFGQVDDIMTRSHEGTGLGLSLCKSLMEIHEGTITIESEIGKGTSVALFFPSTRVVR